MDGSTTRATRAASRAPRVARRPIPVPTYHGATFSASLVLHGLPMVAPWMEPHGAIAARPALPETASGVASVRFPMLPSLQDHAVVARPLASSADPRGRHRAVAGAGARRAMTSRAGSAAPATR